MLDECVIVNRYARIVIASRDRLSFESRKRFEKLVNKIKEIFELKQWPPRISRDKDFDVV